MLSESSYHLAMAAYLGAGGLAVILLAWWLIRRWPGFFSVFFVLLCAALLLTPAFPKEGVTTLAPALIVAGFQILTSGVDAAQHAIRPLVVASVLAFLLALVLRFTLIRRYRRPKVAPGAQQAKVAAPAESA